MKKGTVSSLLDCIRGRCSRQYLAALLLLLAAAEFQAARAQDRHPVTGRRFAQVMGAAGADWLVRPERELEEQPGKVLDEMNLRPGMTVADVGTGVGYFAERMARKVGPAGKVFANDIQPEMLELLRERLARQKLRNVEPVLGAADDPKLPQACCDYILLVDVYHEFSQPQKMLARMKESLKPGGRLVLVEYRKEDPAVPIRFEHKMSVDEVRAELEAEGFELERISRILPRQHIFFFRAAPGKPGQP
jgi:SAM-dependent methyltransferase